MKQILQIRGFWVFIIALSVILSGCKTQSTIHNSPSGAQSTIIRDSISVTYRQGKEQPASPDAIGAQTDFRKNSSAPALGKVGLGATREAAVFEEVQSARTKKQAVPPIRVDTVVIEKWHTQKETEEVQVKYTPPFYKRCTWGFWILLFLLLGSIAIRILQRFIPQM